MQPFICNNLSLFSPLVLQKLHPWWQKLSKLSKTGFLGDKGTVGLQWTRRKKKHLMEAVLTGNWGVLGEPSKALFKTNCTVLFKTTFQFPLFVPVIFVLSAKRFANVKSWHLAETRRSTNYSAFFSLFFWIPEWKENCLLPSAVFVFFCLPSASCKTSDLLFYSPLWKTIYFADTVHDSQPVLKDHLGLLRSWSTFRQVISPKHHFLLLSVFQSQLLSVHLMPKNPLCQIQADWPFYTGTSGGATVVLFTWQRKKKIK